MLIEFSLGNYRSFNKIQTLNLRATTLVSDEKNKSVDTRNIVTVGEHRLLKTVGIYGPNASGKSNIGKGFSFFRNMIAWSLSKQELLGDYVDAFKLKASASGHSGYFQCVVFLFGRKFRYGFTIDNNSGIGEEWLFGPAEKNETYYYKRQAGHIEINEERFPEGVSLPLDKLRKDALFLSFCASYDGEISGGIRDFFAVNIFLDTAHPNDFASNVTLGARDTDSLVVIENRSNLVLQWFRAAGLNYLDIRIKKNSGFRVEVDLLKPVYDDKGDVISSRYMSLWDDESDGTRKFYSYIGWLYRIFEKGGAFFADEIDSNFHPALLRHIIGMFNDPAINKANAQLIFTSHDTNLMEPSIMRRDQFYFTEKSARDETVLYSLSDLKGIRNNADFARQYLAGFYGALPVLGNFLNISNSENQNTQG